MTFKIGDLSFKNFIYLFLISLFLSTKHTFHPLSRKELPKRFFSTALFFRKVLVGYATHCRALTNPHIFNQFSFAPSQKVVIFFFVLSTDYFWFSPHLHVSIMNNRFTVCQTRNWPNGAGWCGFSQFLHETHSCSPETHYMLQRWRWKQLLGRTAAMCHQCSW